MKHIRMQCFDSAGGVGIVTWQASVSFLSWPWRTCIRGYDARTSHKESSVTCDHIGSGTCISELNRATGTACERQREEPRCTKIKQVEYIKGNLHNGYRVSYLSFVTPITGPFSSHVDRQGSIDRWLTMWSRKMTSKMSEMKRRPLQEERRAVGLWKQKISGDM